MSDVLIRPYTPADAGWVAQVHNELYQQNESFNDQFLPAVHAALHQIETSNNAAGWIAERHGMAVGCLFFTTPQQHTAQLRLFLLIPAERGAGHGRRMLQHAMRTTVKFGYKVMKVNTFAEHSAACALYASMGFHKTSTRPTHAFGRDLTEVAWERPLTGNELS
ncbi:MAG: N-acetyltransferase family protein [Roseovarius sp.]